MAVFFDDRHTHQYCFKFVQYRISFGTLGTYCGEKGPDMLYLSRSSATEFNSVALIINMSGNQVKDHLYFQYSLIQTQTFNFDFFV